MVELGFENKTKRAALDDTMTRSVKVVAGLATATICSSGRRVYRWSMSRIARSNPPSPLVS